MTTGNWPTSEPVELGEHIAPCGCKGHDSSASARQAPPFAMSRNSPNIRGNSIRWSSPLRTSRPTSLIPKKTVKTVRFEFHVTVPSLVATPPGWAKYCLKVATC